MEIERETTTTDRITEAPRRAREADHAATATAQEPRESESSSSSSSTSSSDQRRTATAEEVTDLVTKAEAVFGANPQTRLKILEFARGYRLSWVNAAVDLIHARTAEGRTIGNPFGFMAGVLRNWRQEGGPPGETPAFGSSGDPAAREAAAAASALCPDCQGTGRTTRYRHKSAGSRDTNGRDVAPAITLYCLCPLGRWSRANDQQKSTDIRKRTYDLADHPFLQLGPVAWSDQPDNQYRYPLDEWDEWDEQPIRPCPPRARPIPDDHDEARRDSMGCPECHASGKARRRLAWATLRSVFAVDLYCRCPLGRHLAETDPEASDPIRTDDRSIDDLQAHPELWDPELDYPRWSDEPSESHHRLDPKLRYLGCEEPDRITSTRTLAACLVEAGDEPPA